MIAVFITIFVAILIGVSLIGPLATQVTTNAATTNSSGGACLAAVAGSATEPGCQLYLASSWGASVLKMVPGFFSLIILGVVVAGLYSVFRQAGIV